MKHHISVPIGVELPAVMKAADFAALVHGRAPVTEFGGKMAATATIGIRLHKERKMSKVESEYEQLLMREFPESLGYKVRYETITLRLPGGSRYTPDFTVFRINAGILMVETKGAYRLGSAGRSHMAFNEAMAAFPEYAFRFAQKTPSGWITKEGKKGFP